MIIIVHYLFYLTFVKRDRAEAIIFDFSVSMRCEHGFGDLWGETVASVTHRGLSCAQYHTRAIQVARSAIRDKSRSSKATGDGRGNGRWKPDLRIQFIRNSIFYFLPYCFQLFDFGRLKAKPLIIKYSAVDIRTVSGASRILSDNNARQWR